MERHIRRPALVLVTVLLLVAALPGVALGEQDDSATIRAEVTIEAAEACLLIDVEEIDFGVLNLGDTAVSDPPYTVESCSTGDQRLFAHGTDAANEAATVNWSLVDTDPPSPNQFSVDATLAGIGSEPLVTDPRAIGQLPTLATADATHQLVLPPPGSSGAGETMTFDLVWTAVLDDGSNG